MGNKAPNAAQHSKKTPIQAHKRNTTESELYNFRDNLDIEKSTQYNLQEFIYNQNELNALIKAYLLDNHDPHPHKHKLKRHEILDNKQNEKDLLVELPQSKDKKVSL